ncbi:Fur family transcriptional regulator [Citricoccus sp. GCM10030269]|uniref:Fur family transcriptional regulator n=1 Tax=Citricoccus sp. GCM10030269 TaxID=3273388 RepID=UPI00361A3BFE
MNTDPARPVKGRSTRQKTAVNRALNEREDFVSAQDLFSILKDRGEQVSLATVYRILQQQQQDGQVDVLNPDDGESLFRRCQAQTHHHHLLCRQCGRAVEIEAPDVEQWAATTAAEHGFTAAEHTVEIYGICPDCSRG